MYYNYNYTYIHIYIYIYIYTMYYILCTIYYIPYTIYYTILYYTRGLGAFFLIERPDPARSAPPAL